MQATRRHAAALTATALVTATVLTTAWAVGTGSTEPASVQRQVDFWNYDAKTGRKTSNSSPGVAPHELAALYAATAADLPAVTGPHGQVDFWNYDPETGRKTSNSSPGVAPHELARLFAPTG